MRDMREKAMTDQDNLRDNIAAVIETAGHEHEANRLALMPRADYIAQAIIDEFELTVLYSSRQHAHGSALQFGETPEEYAERVRMKTIYKVEGRFSE